MTGNVHKREFSKVTLPEIFQEEDRGLSRCGTPIRVLASSTSTHRYKNDLTGIALICDELTVLLEKSNGDVIPALGIEVDFPFQPNAKGFVIDWRQHLDHIDCYKVKVVFNIAGIVGEYYYGAFDLKQWSWELAKGTVQVFSVLDDYVRTTGINYGDSGFCDTIRFDGTFGEMQPNYQTENITYHDRERKKVRREAIRTYYLNTSFLVNCFTSKIDENHLLAASQIYITEHNPFNHEQYREFPVILSEEESPTFEYPKGGYAVVRAVFLDKKAYYESKYNGKTSGVANVSLELPKGIDCDGGGGDTCLDATVTNGGSYVDTVASGGTLLLPTENITVNGNLLVNKPSVEDYNVEVVDSENNAVSTSISGGKVVIDDLPCAPDTYNWKFQFINQTDTIQIEVDTSMLHTFTSGSGVNIGTMEVSTDGVNYTPITYPFTPSVGTLYFKRSTALITATYTMNQ